MKIKLQEHSTGTDSLKPTQERLVLFSVSGQGTQINIKTKIEMLKVKYTIFTAIPN